jgi:hypothetical protein
MKCSFKSFLAETDTSFYSLYTLEVPSKETREMKDGPEKEEKIKVEQIKYKSVLTDFLLKVSSMN